MKSEKETANNDSILVWIYEINFSLDLVTKRNPLPFHYQRNGRIQFMLVTSLTKQWIPEFEIKEEYCTEDEYKIQAAIGVERDCCCGYCCGCSVVDAATNRIILLLTVALRVHPNVNCTMQWLFSWCYTNAWIFHYYFPLHHSNRTMRWDTDDDDDDSVYPIYNQSVRMCVGLYLCVEFIKDNNNNIVLLPIKLLHWITCNLYCAVRLSFFPVLSLSELNLMQQKIQNFFLWTTMV